MASGEVAESWFKFVSVATVGRDFQTLRVSTTTSVCVFLFCLCSWFNWGLAHLMEPMVCMWRDGICLVFGLSCV